MSLIINYKPYDESKLYIIPEYADSGCSGMDLYSSNKEIIELESGKFKLIDTNISVEIPIGYEGQVRSKSGLALKNGLFVLNSPGTIDASYRGSIGVILANLSDKSYFIEPQQKIAQLVIMKIETVVLQQAITLNNTERGNGGFGSTGLK